VGPDGDLGKPEGDQSDRRDQRKTKGTSVEIRGRPEPTWNWRKTMKTEGTPERDRRRLMETKGTPERDRKLTDGDQIDFGGNCREIC